MTVSITALSARSGGQEMCVCFETVSDDGVNKSRESFVISSRQYLTLGLCRGECDTDTYDDVCAMSEIWSAVKRGMVMLGYGACSERSLASKLYAKGFDKETSKKATEELVAMGLINEKNDAAQTAIRLASKLWGRKRISAALFEKGYSGDAVDAALDDLEDEGVDYVENCRRLFEKKYGEVPCDPAEKKKMMAALMRYGYTVNEICEAVKRV